jgi:hypothetical protein
MKEYNHNTGYVRETILIFTDPDLKKEDYALIKSKLNSYNGNHGEVINIEILKNENGPGAIIQVVIICFKSLLRLLNVTDVYYNNFIDGHQKKFVENYKKIICSD